MLAAKIQTVGQAVDLERDALLQRDLKYPLQVERILRTPVDDPALRMTEATHVRIAQRFLDALGHLPLRHPLSAVHACLDPLELRKHVVGKIESPVGKDVA